MSMKKIFTLVLAVVAMSFCANAQVSDGFEDYDPFTVDPAGFWSYIDVDGGQAYTYQGVTMENLPYVGSAIVVDPTLTNPSIEDSQAPHSGSQYLAIFNSIPSTIVSGSTTNDWVISPEFSSMSSITLWARELTDSYGPETMKIWYSTIANASSPSDFQLIQTVNVNSTEWTEYTFNIPAGAKHVAINCASNDVFALFIDDVTINGSMVTSVESVEANQTSVYPNPANNVINVTSVANMNSIEVYTIAGQKVANYTVNGTQAAINVNNLSNGMYIMQIASENGVSAQKFNVAR